MQRYMSGFSVKYTVDQKAAKYRCISALQPVIYRSPAVTDPVLYEDSDYFWDSVCTVDSGRCVQQRNLRAKKPVRQSSHSTLARRNHPGSETDLFANIVVLQYEKCPVRIKISLRTWAS